MTKSAHSMIPVSVRIDGACFPVFVQPRSSKDELAGELDGELKVRITAPPVEGAANKHLIKFLAKRLGYPKNRLLLVAGDQSRHKLICIKEASKTDVEQLLSKIL